MAQQSLKSALASVGRLFADVNAVHTRAALAATALDEQQPLRVALIAFQTDRTRTKRVLDNVVVLDTGVPLAQVGASERLWQQGVRARGLGKDTLVRHGLYAETIHNAAQTVTAPSEFLARHRLELVESFARPQTPGDLIAPCHLNVFVADSVAAFAQPLPPALVPAVRVADAAVADGAAGAAAGVVVVSSAVAERAQAEAGSDWQLASGYERLRERLVDRAGVARALVESVADTCDAQVAETRAFVAAGGGDIRALRESWAAGAHAELQGASAAALDAFERRAAWWRLYFAADDLVVHGERLAAAILPAADRSLAFALGRLHALPFERTSYTLPAAAAAPPSAESSIARAQVAVRTELVPALAAAAQRLLVATLLQTQLPVAAVAFGGWCYMHYSAYAMAAVGLLGVVVGLRRLQAAWLAELGRFKAAVGERAAAAVDEAEAELYNVFERRTAGAAGALAAQAAAAAALRNVHK
ncbi:uncharacterized protein V1510DRAFT_368124 [Dipodascopsis tothii]|uniref:uncharacterized protein n=1 Tax=Dipodascopsis tothii TaxID=44089 RepID=UPI0034CED7D1